MKHFILFLTISFSLSAAQAKSVCSGICVTRSINFPLKTEFYHQMIAVGIDKQHATMKLERKCQQSRGRLVGGIAVSQSREAGEIQLTKADLASEISCDLL